MAVIADTLKCSEPIALVR